MKPLFLHLLALSAGLSTSLTAGEFIFRHEHILGTSMELIIETGEESDAKAAESAVLAEIDRLNAVLNTWAPDSEASKLLGSPAGEYAVSPDLRSVLKLCDVWEAKSGGSFNPRVGILSKLWEQAEKNQQLPSPAALHAAVTAAGHKAWTLGSASGSVKMAGPSNVTLSGISKDYIVDLAGKKALDALPAKQERSVILNIGGDLRHWGNQPITAAVTNPAAPGENQAPISLVSLQNRALATSGSYRRGWDIQGQHYSHVLNPLTGQPVREAASISVIARDAVSANALAVSLSTMPVDQALGFASAQAAECLIVTSNGTCHRSPGWPEQTFVTSTPGITLGQAAPAGNEAPALSLTLAFEIPSKGKRPYVAAWIADKDGFPVRTLLLWILQGSKQQKWLPDLRQWYRDDKTRQLVDPTDLVRTKSSATRRGGKYDVTWDGLDDAGKPIPMGSYTLHLEAVREDGTNQLIKYPFNWNGEAFEAALPGGIEITSASVKAVPATK